jgi:hypothetical protein
VVYPTGNANENGTDGTKGHTDLTIQLQSDYGASDSRSVKDRNAISPRSKGTEVNRFIIENRDANSIINSELEVEPDIFLGLRMEISDHARLRRIFHEGAG